MQALHFDERWRDDPTTGCRIWIGVRNQEGYGRFGQKLAHRMAWERINGPIAPGLVIDHLCKNPACINLDHLDLVEQAVNMRRGRNTKLTADIVKEIRASSETHAALARRFGVASQTIRWARNGWTWQDI